MLLNARSFLKNDYYFRSTYFSDQIFLFGANCNFQNISNVSSRKGLRNRRFLGIARVLWWWSVTFSHCEIMLQICTFGPLKSSRFRDLFNEFRTVCKSTHLVLIMSSRSCGQVQVLISKSDHTDQF